MTLLRRNEGPKRSVVEKAPSNEEAAEPDKRCVGVGARETGPLEAGEGAGGVTWDGIVPVAGEERISVDETSGMVMREGSSLRIMSKASELINEEFTSDPTKDWKKYQQRSRQLFYVVMEDPRSNDEAVCALRAVLDLGGLPKEPHRKRRKKAKQWSDGGRRVIIDYVQTKDTRRGCRFAQQLTEHVKNIATTASADMYVLSTEEAASYWLKLGFVLEQDPNLDAEFNIFSDTHLMKLSSNKSGSKSLDFVVRSEGSTTGTSDESGTGKSESTADEAASDEHEAGQEDDVEIQQAIAASLGTPEAPCPGHGGNPGEEHMALEEYPEEDEGTALARAIEMSLWEA